MMVLTETAAVASDIKRVQLYQKQEFRVMLAAKSGSNSTMSRCDVEMAPGQC